MKPYFAALLLLLLRPPTERLLLVDKALKKPLATATEFTTGHYLQRLFPVYAADVPAVVATADKAVKWLGQEQACHGTARLTAAHTTFLLNVNCETGRTIDVILMTDVAGTKTSFSFVLAKNEEDLRKAQRKLLDFATYLEQEPLSFGR